LISIEKRHATEIIAHATEEDPNECCGILAGKDGVVVHAYRITNSVKSPVRYLMDPQEQLNAMLDSERNGWEFLAFYHSHTHSPAYPSDTDVRMALESGWLDVDYILVSLATKTGPEIRAFHIDDTGRIAEEKLRIV
jgi:proteasome lid subunit RPN8/RPN11